MEVLVFVEPTADGFRAVPLSSGELVGVGRSEADALYQLTTRLRAGRLVRVELAEPSPAVRYDPVLEAALKGLASAPPEVWQAYDDAIAENRRLQAEADAREFEHEPATSADGSTNGHPDPAHVPPVPT